MMKTRQDKRLRQPTRYEGGIPQYSLGGILANTATGAASGAISGGGLLSLPGALIGGGVGLITGLFSHFGDRKREKAEAREEERQRQINLGLGKTSGAVQASAGGSFNNFTDMWAAGKGGVVSGGSPVVLRNKEMLIGPDGTTVPTEALGINTPQHTDKGITTLEDGTVIVSPENTGKAKLIAKRQKPEIGKLNKVLENRNSTPLARKSAERRLEALKQEYMPLIIADAQNRIKQGGNIAGGGIPEAGFGEIIKGVGKFLKSDTGKNVLGGVASVAPLLYNIGKAGQKAEYMNPAAYQNPMAYDALATMRNRQPNVTPALQATDTAMAGAESNLRSTATGRGQYMSGRVALANAGMTNKANIYAQASQEQNRMLGEYGQMQAGLGQKMADTNLIVEDLNARNRAARRNYAASAVGQLGQWAQTQQLMGNQRRRDDMMMEQFKGWLGMMKSGKQGGVPVPPTSQLPFMGNGSFDAQGNWINGE